MLSTYNEMNGKSLFFTSIVRTNAQKCEGELTCFNWPKENLQVALPLESNHNLHKRVPTRYHHNRQSQAFSLFNYNTTEIQIQFYTRNTFEEFLRITYWQLVEDVTIINQFVRIRFRIFRNFRA